jgi:hypothetical protein
MVSLEEFFNYRMYQLDLMCNKQFVCHQFLKLGQLGKDYQSSKLFLKVGYIFIFPYVH